MKIIYHIIPFISNTLYPQLAAVWKADGKTAGKILKTLALIALEFIPFVVKEFESDGK